MSQDTLAAAREAIAHSLGLHLYPVQLRAAEALLAGKIVEMQTGEGKTVAAVPAIHSRPGSPRRPRLDRQRLPRRP